jgi:hypothetical protein
MRRRLAAMLLAGLALAGSGAFGGAEMSDPRPPRSTDQPRPRDGDVAIRQELEAARRAGTLEAYDLFLQRHADHPLAAIAHRERDELALRRKN